jgi:hypothetical protein
MKEKNRRSEKMKYKPNIVEMSKKELISAANEIHDIVSFMDDMVPTIPKTKLEKKYKQAFCRILDLDVCFNCESVD